MEVEIREIVRLGARIAPGPLCLGDGPPPPPNSWLFEEALMRGLLKIQNDQVQVSVETCTGQPFVGLSVAIYRRTKDGPWFLFEGRTDAEGRVTLGSVAELPTYLEEDESYWLVLLNPPAGASAR